MSNTPSPEARARYWRKNLCWLGGLLVIWFVVSYGCGILLVEQLDKVMISTKYGVKSIVGLELDERPKTGVKLGFWFAQQGSIYVFVLLIAVYVFVMNRLDRELLGENDE